jgi:xanthine dehydrogenase FAD-binding subunit
MSLWQYYLRPTTVNDALKALASAEGLACPIAGGTDLMLDLQQGRHAPFHTLVDITVIPELTTLEIRQGKLFLGAAVPLSRIASSILVSEQPQAWRKPHTVQYHPSIHPTALKRKMSNEI